MKTRTLAIYLTAAALMCLVSGVSAFADTTVGIVNAGNCYPFLCNDSGTSSGQTIDYQQVYSSAAFSGTQSITGLTFSFNPVFLGTSTVLTGTYDIYLSTTSAAVNGLSSTAASNRGLDYTLVDIFTGGVDSNPSFTINTSTFNYDPTTGNLLLEVIAFDQPNVPNGSGNGYIAADGTGTSTSRAWGLGATSTLRPDSIGLVTTFNTSVATPEPGSMGLLGFGILGLAAVKLSKR
jgi:PEP-CTERM motif